MNKTKYALIITAIVLNFISVALNVYLAVLFFLQAAYDKYFIMLGIYELLGAAAYFITSALLIYSIAGKGVHFRGRSGYYMTAVVLTLMLNLFSVPSVLLIITLFMSDWVWVKPIDDVYFKKDEEEKQKDDKKTKEQKIAELRQLRDEGKITEEEFNDQLFRLL